MKTKDIPAIVMLLAGGVYCLLGILYQIPLMDFLVQLLIVLLVFWMIGGIIRMLLDKFMGEIEDKTKKEEEETEEKDADGETEESDENSKEETEDSDVE
ncbi:MAG: hypothetical protein IJE49_08970 [Agathobacter sp.]|nr:hypothetical protein [Agathobacter sp.]